MRSAFSIGAAAALFVCCFGAAQSQAAAPAFDDSTSAAYDDGWDAGDNGGSGFGSWLFLGGAVTEYEMGSSTTNGDGDTDLDGDIDVGGDSFGITTSTSGVRRARRNFASPFAIGEILTIDIDPTFAITSPEQSYQASIELVAPSLSQRLRVGYFPGAGGWGMQALGPFASFPQLPASDEGVTIRIERLDDTDFELQLIGLEAEPFVTTGSFGGSGDIAALQLTQIGVAGSTMSTFFNSMQVQTAPEAGATTAAGAALAALALAKRLRSRA